MSFHAALNTAKIARDRRGSRMALEPNSERDGALVKALKHLQEAIELLDNAGAPPNIAAHLDLAAHQLGAVIQSDDPGTGQQVLD